MAKKIKLKVSSRVLKKRSRKSSGVKRQCRFSKDKNLYNSIDYKNAALLKSLLTECGKILASRIPGNSAACQRKLSQAIKRARTMALLPYCSYQ